MKERNRENINDSSIYSSKLPGAGHFRLTVNILDGIERLNYKGHSVGRH